MRFGMLLPRTGPAGRHVRETLEGAGLTEVLLDGGTDCDLTDAPTTWARLDAFRPNNTARWAGVVDSVCQMTDFAADVVDVNMRTVLDSHETALVLRQVMPINHTANCAYLWVVASVLWCRIARRLTWVLSACCVEQHGVRSVNVVVPDMYSRDDSTNPSKTHALNALIIMFAKGMASDAPKVEVGGTGKPIREWLFVGGFSLVVLQTTRESEDSLEPVNLAQNEGYTVTELVETIRKSVGYEGEVTYNCRYQDGSPKKEMNDRYFGQRFPGFHFIPIEAGIENTVDYYHGIL
jgi:GDP-L-fucose synthase